MRKPLLISVLVLLALAAGCQTPPQQEIAVRTAAQVEADFDALRAEYERLENGDDAAGLAALHAEDAVVVDPFGAVTIGRSAVLQANEASLPSLSNAAIHTDGVVFSGDMVAGHGTASENLVTPEGETTIHARWLCVALYQPDGTLKIRLFQAMIPPPPAAAEGPGSSENPA